MKMTSPDEMVKRIMSEKYKTTYQVEYNKDGLYIIFYTKSLL